MKKKEYIIENAKLMKEWDWEKNNEFGFDPNKLTKGNNIKVWWKCAKCNNSWNARISGRSIGKGCPLCAKKHNVTVGEDDFATAHPELLTEWDYEKNDALQISPNNISFGSGKKVWWKCNKGHEWSAMISSRHSGSGCPYCCNRKVLKGFNDLATTCPDVLIDWDYTKNKNVTPSDVTKGSSKKISWKCHKCSCEWITSVAKRVSESGCPNCMRYQTISLSETKVYYYVKKYFNDSINKYINRDIGITELDIFVPSLNIGIEYDGQLWHKDVNRDLKKDKACSENCIKLIRIRERNCPKYESDCEFVVLNNETDKSLELAIYSVLNILKIDKYDVDLKRDNIKIQSLMSFKNESESLSKLYPDIASEWDYSKNGTVTPDNVKPHSSKRFWWTCSVCNNNWESTVTNRTRGRGCPVCGKEKSKKSCCKKIYCPELDMVFESVKEAANYVDIKSSCNISFCLNGKYSFAGRHPATNEKLHWQEHEPKRGDDT